MSVAVVGAGAFGTALAITLARGDQPVTLWGRDPGIVRAIMERRENARYLPGLSIPQAVKPVLALEDVQAEVVLLAVPMQSTAAFLRETEGQLQAKTLIACAKGIDVETGLGPARLVEALRRDAEVAMLTGPSFADELAGGLPTALTLASRDLERARALSEEITRPGFRVYSSADLPAAELGGALKNVIAIAAGICIGAGLGENARAAVISRGYAEMGRIVDSFGGARETLGGLSGLGDLVLTAMSEKSRNTRAGIFLGRGQGLPQGITIEGVATAQAMAAICRDRSIDAPLIDTVSSIVRGEMTVSDARDALLARPLRSE